MKGYKIPKGFVEGYRNAIGQYPKDSEYAWGMNAVVEALEVYPLEELDENPWCTGTPTEEGWYLIKYKWDGEIRYIATDTLVKTFVEDSRTIGWQKIEEN